MIKKLLGVFKSLPPEVRMMLAMAGLGTPFGALWLLKNYLFPNTSMIVLMFGVAGVLLLLGGIGWLCAVLFGAGKRKRTQKLANDLTRQEGVGPVSMDVRAAIKGNNEKFFSAIRDMRKNLNVNVYDLPWYIVIGDSGCGKTKLINEGGLTFSTGKPEGYQLGTLNYNWWFTEDAIFVDMAGRLCNPQDDADHKEWSAFLDTVGKGRKGYPINGAIVCVSAEHLLQDPPEKHEQDANTALERLRDLQTKLGVTFATYLVVTKCDKILGFMQFFDRAERDISFRNQIFGWSKPGSFSELYDPEEFKQDFDGVYTRLNELRIKRLNDDVEETELGLAYSFPEEFREIRDPLQTYMRTLFPMIKQARVVKNLILRGVYFTTATQQGSVILKHLSERLGKDAAQNFPPLESLYPKPRAHFIKDLFFRKVFKEYGLVFRNEQEAARNRRLAKMFRIATVAICVLVATGLTFGIMRFDSLINKARMMVVEQKNDKGQMAPSVAAASAASEVKALETCRELGIHRKTLEENPWAARLLSLFWNSGEPQRHLLTIETGLFQEGVLRKALRRVEEKLAGADLGRCNDSDPRVKEQADRFFNSLVEYVYLASFKDRPDEKPELTQERLLRLFAIIKEKNALGSDVILENPWDNFVSELGVYIAATSTEGHLNPSAVLAERNFDPAQTVAGALENYRRYLEPAATMNAEHPDPVIRQWMRIREACAGAMGEYVKILESSEVKVENRQQLLAFKTGFESNNKAFAESLDNCSWKAGMDDTGRAASKVESLSSAVERIQKEWMDKYLLLYRTYTRLNPDGTLAAASGASDSLSSATDAAITPVAPDIKNLSKPIVDAITGFVDRRTGESSQEEGLNETLRRTLRTTDLLDADKLALAEERSTSKSNELHKYIKEVVDVHGYLIEGRRRSGDPAEVIREIALTSDADKVRAALGEVAGMLSRLASDSEAESSALSIEEWTTHIGTLADQVSDAGSQEVIDLGISKANSDVWAARRLGEFVQSQQVLVARGNLTQAIEGAGAAFSAVSDASGWGMAILMPEFNKAQPSFYSINLPEVAPAEKAKPGRSGGNKTESVESKGPKRFSAMGGRRTGASPKRPTARATPSVRDRLYTESVPTCATRQGLFDTFASAGGLVDLCLQIPAEYCLAEDGSDPVRSLLESIMNSKKAYLGQYFVSWDNAYRQAEFKALEPITSRDGWADVRTVMRSFQTDVGRKFASATAELLENVAWADFRWTGDAWRDDQVLLNDARYTAFKDFKFQREIVDLAGLDIEQPWATVAQRLESGWTNFARTVATYPELPSEFNDAGQTQSPKIEWDVVDAELAHRLQDLKFVQIAIKAANHCRASADREVHARLYKIQLGYHFTGDALPYIEGKEIETVDPKNFARFVRQVLVAQTLLEPLDKTLDGYATRKPFYQSCREWEEFIAPGDTDAYSKPLSAVITMDPDYAKGQHLGVRWIDAKDAKPWSSGAPVTGAANFYSRAELLLGLTTPDNQDTVTMSLTAEAGVMNASWLWPSEGRFGYMATVKLSGKGREIYKRDWPELSVGELGRVDELLFPAFLERMGSPDQNRKVWRVGIRWDLKDLYSAINARDAAGDMDRLSQLSPEDKVVGTKFEFTLDQRLPPAIRCLKEKLDQVASSQ